jgi:hypothetical protein
LATPLRSNTKEKTKTTGRRLGLNEREQLGANKAVSRIIPVGDVEDYLNILVYARGGMGKTTFGASSGLKTLIIDFNEQGTISVKKRPNTFRYEVQYWEELDWIYWLLKSGKHDYEVVVLDTVTSMANICMKWVLGDEASRDASRDPMVPDKRGWGKVGELMKLRITDFRNLPLHTVFTAHERVTETEDEETDETHVEVVPSLSPAPREALIGAVHVIGRLYTREVEVVDKTKKKSIKKSERRMLIGPHPRYVSKVRIDPDQPIQPPRIVRNPTMKYFINVILPKIDKSGVDTATLKEETDGSI